MTYMMKAASSPTARLDVGTATLCCHASRREWAKEGSDPVLCNIYLTRSSRERDMRDPRRCHQLLNLRHVQSSALDRGGGLCRPTVSRTRAS